MKTILTRKYPLRGEMTYARSLTYKHLIKLGDDYDAVQLRGQKKKKENTNWKFTSAKSRAD